MKKSIKVLSIIIAFLNFIMCFGTKSVYASDDITGFANEVAKMINEIRIENGINPVKTAPILMQMADDRAKELTDFYSHNRPGGSKWYTILKDYNLGTDRYAGENIAAGYISPEEVIDGWMNSSGHRSTILNSNYDYVCVGVRYKDDDPDYYFYYWDCIFISGDSFEGEYDPSYYEKQTTTTTTATTTTELTTTTRATTTTTTTTTTTSTSTTKLTTITTDELKIDKTSIILKNGEQYQISANQSNLIYKSNNNDIAIVSKNGLLTAVGEGDAIISVINSDSDVVQLKVKVVSAYGMIGDLNQDGSITISDLIILQKFILGIQKITKEQAKLADLTQDNIVNVLDLTILKHRLLSYNMYI